MVKYVLNVTSQRRLRGQQGDRFGDQRERVETDRADQERHALRIGEEGFREDAGPACVARRLLPVRADCGRRISAGSRLAHRNDARLPFPTRRIEFAAGEQPGRAGGRLVLGIDDDVMRELVRPLRVVEPVVGDSREHVHPSSADSERQMRMDDRVVCVLRIGRREQRAITAQPFQRGRQRRGHPLRAEHRAEATAAGFEALESRRVKEFLDHRRPPLGFRPPIRPGDQR